MVRNSIIWTSCFMLALLSGLLAMGAITKNNASEFAVTLKPSNGLAAESLVSRSLMGAVAANQGQFPAKLDKSIWRLARQAFILEPATPAAVAALALGKTGAAKAKLMQVAFVLSRRERLVAGWLIADAGARGDIRTILNSYDTLLRTSDAASSVVMPVMANALENEKFIGPFADLLSRKPPWAAGFWEMLTRVPKVLLNAALLRERLYKPGEMNESYRDAELITSLVNNKNFERAEKLYNVVIKDSQYNSLVRNSSFNSQSGKTPLDWQIFSTGEYGASIAGGNLQLSAISNSGGVFARQLVNLPESMLAIDIAMTDQKSDNAELYVNLSCATTNAVTPVRISLDKDRVLKQINNTGSGCNYYWLDITGKAMEAGDGFDVYLSSVKITKK